MRKYTEYLYGEMRIKQKSAYLLIFVIFSAQILSSQDRLYELRDTLQHRMSHISRFSDEFLPPIEQDLSLFSNASYIQDTIYFGNVQRFFQTFEDSLSLVYHEYIHHILQKKQAFDLEKDLSGNIVQWMTEETYFYQRLPEEVVRYAKHFREELLPSYPNYSSMSAEQKEKLIAHMERDYAKSQKEFFKYAPSNLAKEELVAYRQQLQGEKLGLYSLSRDASQEIEIRIKQLKDTFKRRRRYEKKNKLKRSGERKDA